MRIFNKLLAAAIISTCIEISGAYAQLLPPANVNAGAVNKINSEYKTDFNKTIEGTVKEEPLKIKNPEEMTKKSEVPIEKFKLNKINFSGNTVIKTADLNKIVSNFSGNDVSIEDINKIIEKITALYKNNGYITSFAYIPEQEVKDGELKISIFEGKVGKINIQGAKWTKTSYLKNNIFKANNLQKNEVFKINNIQKSMLQINNTDYIKGQITIQKGEEPATTDIILDVKDRLPLNLSAGWDNQGRDLIGVQRANIFITDNNLTGFGDSLYGGISLAERTFGINSGYSIPIGPYGTELRLGFSNSSVNVGGSYEQLKIQGASRLFSTTLSQPIYKGETFNLTSNFSFDLSHSKTTMQEITSLQDYGLRIFRFGLNAVKEDKRGRWISSAQVSSGIPVCDAESKIKLGELSHKFIRFNTNLIRVQALPLNTTGILRVSTQFSPNNLLSNEQIQIGGNSTVRGFNEGLLIGDVGYNASAELRKTIPYLPDFSVPYWKNKSFRVNLKDRIQLAAFYDQGFAKVLEKNTPATYANFLQGIGVGLRCQLSKYLMANIDMGIPLGRKREENQNSVKLHFGLSSNFF